MKYFNVLLLIGVGLTSCQPVSVIPTSGSSTPTSLSSPGPVPTFPSIDVLPDAAFSSDDLSRLMPITIENAVRLKPIRALTPGMINSFTWSPDGRAIVAATSHGLRVYSASDLQQTPVDLSPFPTQSYFVLFSPMGTQMVWAEPAGKNDLSLSVWNLVNGEQKMIPPYSGKLLGISFDLNEQLILATLFDNAIKVWLAENNTLLASFEGMGDAQSVTFSPDARLIASTGHADLQVHVWNVETGEEVGTIGKPDLYPTSVAFHPGDHTMAIGYQGAVQLWDLDHWTEVKFLRQGTGRQVSRMVFNADGSLLAVPISFERTMLILDSELNRVAEIENGGAQFSPDGNTLAVLTESGLKLYDTSAWQVRDSPPPPLKPVQQMVFQSDKPVLVSTHEEGTTIAWDLQTGTQVSQIAAPGKHFISPDGRFLAVGAENGDVSVWDVDTGSMLNSYSHPSEWGISTILFSQDDQLLTISYSASTMSVAFWEWQTDQEPTVYSLGEGLGYIGSLMSDGSKMAVRITENEISSNVGVWDAQSHSMLWTSGQSDSAWISSASLHPDKSILAIGDRWDGSISLYDVNSGVLLKELNKPAQPPDYDVTVDDIDFSNTGHFMVTRVEGRPIIWNLNDYTFINIQGDCISSIESLVFSPDDSLLVATGDKTIVIGGVEGRMCIWETRTGKLLQSLGENNDYPSDLAVFNEAGTILATEEKGTIWLWGVVK